MSVEKIVNLNSLPMQLSPEIVAKLKEFRANADARDEQKKAEHAELWALVHSTYPELDADASYSIDSEYLEGDIAILKNRKQCDHGKSGLGGLSSLLRAISD